MKLQVRALLFPSVHASCFGTGYWLCSEPRKNDCRIWQSFSSTCSTQPVYRVATNSSISVNIWARKLVQRAKLKCERCSFHCSQSLCVLTDIHDDNWPVQSIAQMDDIYVIHSVVHVLHSVQGVAISLDPMKLHFFGSLAVRQTFRWCIAVNSRFVSWPVSMMVIVWLIGQMDDIYVIHSSNSSISINIWARKLVQRAKLKCERCSFHRCTFCALWLDIGCAVNRAKMTGVYASHPFK